MRIFVSGSLAYDRIMDFRGLFEDHILREKAHRFNVSFYTESLSESFGGTAGNIAYALALLGEQPILLAEAGNDFAPYRAWLEEHGVDTSHVQIDEKEKTAFATIITDRANNQIASFYPGAMQKPWQPSADHAIFKGEEAFGIVAAGNLSNMRMLPAIYRRNYIPFMFDPGQQINAFTPAKLREMVKLADIVIGNDYEMKIFAEKTGWNIAKIVDGGAIVIVTHGAKGSVIFHHEDGDGAKNGSGGKTEIKIPACKPRRVVDPTGAGDAYRAGFLVGLAEGRSLEVAGRMGSVAASFAIEVSGTQEHTFTKAKFLARYKKVYGKI